MAEKQGKEDKKVPFYPTNRRRYFRPFLQDGQGIRQKRAFQPKRFKKPYYFLKSKIIIDEWFNQKYRFSILEMEGVWYLKR